MSNLLCRAGIQVVGTGKLTISRGCSIVCLRERCCRLFSARPSWRAAPVLVPSVTCGAWCSRHPKRAIGPGCRPCQGKSCRARCLGRYPQPCLTGCASVAHPPLA